ncbi:helix-turn-helix domain-containing protein [Snodgrassella alvi]|uniref:helix-turn-helix domain-containing protein n=1 Tax=Snodgrassella TaxID=1193515 RepID=UPI0018DDD2B5|nr:helix-turn-helix domain-containing protein [Snodgrassella sp. W8158]
MEDTFTCEEAANRCKCKVQTIRDAIKTGELRAAKIGKSYVIRQTNLDIYIRNKEELTAQAVQQHRNRVCYTNTQTAFGISILQQRKAKELDELLKLKTKN